MAGGLGAAGVPASSARSPPRPHALAGFRVGRAEGWRRGGGGRRRAAARSRVRPTYLGRGGAPEAAPPPGPGGGGSASLPQKRRPCPSTLPQRQKRPGWRASGVGRRPPSSLRFSGPRQPPRGSQPPACSLLPRLASHFRPQDPCRPPDLRVDPAVGEGWRAVGPGARAAAASPQPLPHARRRGSAACGVRGDAPAGAGGWGPEARGSRSPLFLPRCFISGKRQKRRNRRGGGDRNEGSLGSGESK